MKDFLQIRVYVKFLFFRSRDTAIAMAAFSFVVLFAAREVLGATIGSLGAVLDGCCTLG